MYNREMKLEFIRTYTQNAKTAKNTEKLFNLAQPYEEDFNKDICAMSVHQLQIVVDDILGMRLSTKWASISILKEYTRWCIRRGYPGAQNVFSEINFLGIEKVQKSMVSGPLHLQRIMNILFDSENEETVDNLYRVYWWLAYAGISSSDAVNILTSDVNLVDMTVNCKGKKHPIYREAIPAFKNAINLKAFRYKHPLYTDIIIRDRVLGDQLLRGVKTEAGVNTLDTVTIKRGAKAFEEGRTKQRLTYKNLKSSGMFYRQYEMERAGFPVDFGEYVYERVKKDATNSQRNALEREYVEEYQRWKLAFTI